MVSSPSTMDLQPAAVASCPEMGTLPASPWAFMACRAPRAVPSFEATTASILFPWAVRMFSIIFVALAGDQFFNPLVSHDFDITLVDEGLNNLHLPLAEQNGIVISGAAAQHDEVTLALFLHHAASLGPVPLPRCRTIYTRQACLI